MPARRGARTRPGSAPEIRARRPTINDVARLAKVSKKTVSRVINDSPFVRDDTRRKITAIIRELGFAPDPQARGLALRRAALVGLICDDPLAPNVVELLQGILDALRGTEFELVLHSADPKDALFLSDIRAFVAGQRLLGVVLAPALCEDRRVTHLLRALGCAQAGIDATARAGRSLREQAHAAAAKLIG